MSDDLFDMRVINDLRDMLGGDVADIYQEYLNNSRKMLVEMEQAAVQQDVETLTRLAHTLKGSSGNLGVALLYELAKDLENEGKSGVIANAAADVRRIQQGFASAEEFLKELASVA